MTHLQWFILLAVVLNPLVTILYHWERLTATKTKRVAVPFAPAVPRACSRESVPVEPLAIVLALKRHRKQAHGSSDLLAWYTDCKVCMELEEKLAMSQQHYTEAA